jgi:hypothetical protein
VLLALWVCYLAAQLGRLCHPIRCPGRHEDRQAWHLFSFGHKGQTQGPYFQAATSSGGEVYVCGWIDSESKIYRAPEQAFTGILSAGQFSAERIGKDANFNAIVVAKCHERGISIL